MTKAILVALLSLPSAAVAYPYGNQYGNHYGSQWRPTYEQPQRSQSQFQVDELKRQRFQSCFNSNATIISYSYGC